MQQPQQAAPAAPQHIHNIKVHIHSGTNAGISQPQAAPSSPMQQQPGGQQDDGSSGDPGAMGDGQQQDMSSVGTSGAPGSKPAFDPASNPTFGSGTSGIQQQGGSSPLLAQARPGASKGSPQGSGSTGAFNGGGRTLPGTVQSRNGAAQGSMNAAGQARTRKKKLPVKPPKAPPEPADVQNARARQSNTLKMRQARETQGKLQGPYRDADAGAGAWPFLGTMM